jgi:hypothetical protein
MPKPVTASPGSSPAADEPAAAQASSRQPAATTSAPSDRICRRGHLLTQLQHRAQALGDQRLRDLRAELLGYPGGAEVAPPDGVVLPLRYWRGDQELSLFSISAVVGTATDVTVQELAIEAFYPADEVTAGVPRARG